jgi:hypothetical protein
VPAKALQGFKAAMAAPVVNGKRLAALRVAMAEYHERAATLRAAAAAGLDEVRCEGGARADHGRRGRVPRRGQVSVKRDSARHSLHIRYTFGVKLSDSGRNAVGRQWAANQYVAALCGMLWDSVRRP